MKSLAEQVRAYMLWKEKQLPEGYGPTDMARDVARFQTRVPEKSQCKRQDIENLLAKDIQRPRYFPELAEAMGTTVDVLRDGAFVPGAGKPLKLVDLNGLEGQLIMMFRGLKPEQQDDVLQHVNRLYASQQDGPSRASPYAHLPTPMQATGYDPTRVSYGLTYSSRDRSRKED